MVAQGFDPRVWYQLRYHRLQSELWHTTARFAAVAAGRGSGKTELSRRRVVRCLSVKKEWRDPLYFYALPTFAQAKRVAWKPILNLIPKNWITKVHETELLIETIFGSTLYVVGMDKPQRIEGVQWDGGVVDESCDQKPGVFDLSILPALSHRDAWCWRIGVPKRTGSGAREFRQTCEKWRTAENSAFFTWPSADILTAGQIEWAKDNLDPRDFNEQYNARWEDMSGAIFYSFAPKSTVDRRINYDPDSDIVVGSDFNVDPMCWILGHIKNERLIIFDELFRRNTNTEATLDELFKRYGRHNAGWRFFGDATGRARKTAAATTDYLRIRNDARFQGRRVHYPKSNPAVADRFAATNALLRNASGERRCFINPRCKHLIEDLQDRGYKEGSNEPDDYGDIGHMTDALGYIIHQLYPVRLTVTQGAPQVYTEAG